MCPYLLQEDTLARAVEGDWGWGGGRWVSLSNLWCCVVAELEVILTYKDKCHQLSWTFIYKCVLCLYMCVFVSRVSV